MGRERRGMDNARVLLKARRACSRARLPLTFNDLMLASPLEQQRTVRYFDTDFRLNRCNLPTVCRIEPNGVAPDRYSGALPETGDNSPLHAPLRAEAGLPSAIFEFPTRHAIYGGSQQRDRFQKHAPRAEGERVTGGRKYC